MEKLLMASSKKERDTDIWDLSTKMVRLVNLNIKMGNLLKILKIYKVFDKLELQSLIYILVNFYIFFMFLFIINYIFYNND
jgi:hypothetical protein